MGHALIAYLVAAIAAASHAAGPPNGTAVALAARPLHGGVVLRASPDGKPLARVGTHGPLGGPLVFGVVGVRGRWVEVTAEALPTGRQGWVRFGRDVAVRPTRWTLRASLSRRQLDVRHDGRLVRTIPVGIGAPDSPTPTRRFAVAEKVTGPFRAGLRLLHPRPHGAPGAPPARLEHACQVLRRHPCRLGPGGGGVGRVPARDRGRGALPHAHRPARHPGTDLSLSCAMIGVR